MRLNHQRAQRSGMFPPPDRAIAKNRERILRSRDEQDAETNANVTQKEC